MDYVGGVSGGADGKQDVSGFSEGNDLLGKGEFRLVVVYEGGAVTDRIFIAGGFAEVSDNRCTVLAEEAMPVEDIDKNAVEQALSTARDGVSSSSSDAARNTLEIAVAVAEAKIQAANNPAYS